MTAVLAVGLGAVASSSASAAFPNFSDCPRSNPDVFSCVNIQARSGTMRIKSLTAPLGESLEIRGGLSVRADGELQLVAPARGNGVYGQPVDVPGGLLGIPLPIPGNAVTATPQLAGSPSDVTFDLAELGVRIPLKLQLRNALIGSSCYIGSNSDPAWLSLTTGTTSPPPPNRPITGRVGTLTDYLTYITYVGNTNVDNSFRVPEATGCGWLSGVLIRPLINLKLGLPSAPGNNTMIVNNDLALGQP